MNKTSDSADETQRWTDLLSQQGRILDQLTGTWFNALRIILMAVALVFVLLAGMMAYMVWSTHRRGEVQFDRTDALYDRVAELQERMEVQWDTGHEALQDEMRALQKDARARLRRDIDALQSAYQDTLSAQVQAAQRLRQDLDRIVRLAEEMKATSQRYAASIDRGQALYEEMGICFGRKVERFVPEFKEITESPDRIY